MNDGENYIQNIYASFLSSMNNEGVSSGSEYASAKQRVLHQKNMIMYLLLKKSISFNDRYHFYFLL